MSLPNPPHSSDELDRLVRGALRARVGRQEPPERVWKRVKLELRPDKSLPSRLRVHWLPVVIQSALTLLLVTLVGVVLQMDLITGDTGRLLPSTIPTTVITVDINEYSTSPSVLPPSNELGTYSLKAHYEANPGEVDPARPVSAPPISYKPELAPWDAVPAPASIESGSPSLPSLAPNRFLHDSRKER
jgi:hypothetical protein